MLCCERPALPAISMPPAAPPSRLPGLDTLRAAAILAVMFFHLTIFGELPEGILPLPWFGWMGVDLFFVLSGFLIGQQLLRGWTEEQRPSFGRFYLRRAARILPAYWFVLLLYFLVPAWRESSGLPPLWTFLTFTLNLDVNLRQHAFSHAWSLCVEEHFYLLLPLLLALLMRRPSARKAVATVALMVAGGVILRGADCPLSQRCVRPDLLSFLDAPRWADVWRGTGGAAHIPPCGVEPVDGALPCAAGCRDCFGGRSSVAFSGPGSGRLRDLPGGRRCSGFLCWMPDSRW